MKHCSQITDCTMLTEIKCVYCEALNYVSKTMDNDPTRCDIEEITCWSCGKDSLVDEVLMEFYPEYPNESVIGHFDGKRES